MGQKHPNAETSNKKKKNGRVAQEEEDLDKIPAELGETHPEPGGGVPAQPETMSVGGAADEKEGNEKMIVESAAVKKRKKKAGAAEVSAVKDEKPIDAVKVKKVPKHVREMQEALARLREAEEKAKKEEEEKQKREEKERQREEELEWQAEEARRRKKEREKDKLRQKRIEGKILTPKQKEEARKLQARREQFLANVGGSLRGTATPAMKRPLYDKKKKAVPTTQKVEKETRPDTVVEAAVDSWMIKESEVIDVEVPSEVLEFVYESGVEEENGDELDAKSWDDDNLSVGTSADEEVESDSDPVAMKSVSSSSSLNAAAIAAENLPIQSQQGAKNKRKQAEPRVANSNAASALKKGMQTDGGSSTGKATLRSPICCIMGLVDAGKTKLLDCIRGTNVQGGEAGGITQQIGATYFPAENILERTRELKADAVLKVPGLLVIDTPGHKLFANLRSRGSDLCDVAILVVDIMDDVLKPQSIEALNLLIIRNTKFIVALNKVDRLYGWKPSRNTPFKKTLKSQSMDVQQEFERRLTKIITLFKEQGLNTELYYRNPETIFIVPTSANTGEGIPDLLLLLANWAPKTMVEKLTFSDKVQCTVLEVKVVKGHGFSIDVILVNGVLRIRDQIVVCGMQEPIVTIIRALLTPHSMKELRVKGSYHRRREITAVQCIKISAQGLKHALAGTSLYVVKPGDDLEDIKETVMEDIKTVTSKIEKSDKGVYVQASTLGSLEALLEFFKTPEVNIPVSGMNIGSVHKKDVKKASVMLEKKKEFATILAFDVKVATEARKLAEDLKVKIFTADVIYHLYDQFKAYVDNIEEERKKQVAAEVVFPCQLKILSGCIFSQQDPILLGVSVLAGIVKVGTPICIPSKNFTDIGQIASIESNGQSVDTAKKGEVVGIKIEGSKEQEKSSDLEDRLELVSHISRRSIDALQEYYGDDLTDEDWLLVVDLKTKFKIR